MKNRDPVRTNSTKNSVKYIGPGKGHFPRVQQFEGSSVILVMLYKATVGQPKVLAMTYCSKWYQTADNSNLHSQHYENFKSMLGP